MAPAEAAPAELRIEVVFCPRPGQVDLVALRLPAGSTLLEALHASGVLSRHGLSAEALQVGVWGKVRELSVPLRDRDRVELYRPLTVDPKEARRQRYRRHKDRLAEGVRKV